MGIANIAATNMEHLCTCAAHGYSQKERWGNAGYGTCKVTCEGHTSTFYKGDRDCSSASIDSWKEALSGTKYKNLLNKAETTSNMKKVFINSGLFEWKPLSFTAQRGDLYLKEGSHVAMCTASGKLAEFSISETGGVTGKWGDQKNDQGAKAESHIRSYYNYPWDGILHYNGKADTQIPAETKAWSAYLKNGNASTKELFTIAAHDKYYVIKASNNSCLDVKDGAVAHKQPVRFYKANSSTAQDWILEEHKDKFGVYYNIKTVLNDKYALAAKGGETLDGTGLVIGKFDDSEAQRWAIVGNGSKYRFVNRKSGLSIMAMI